MNTNPILNEKLTLSRLFALIDIASGKCNGALSYITERAYKTPPTNAQEALILFDRLFQDDIDKLPPDCFQVDLNNLRAFIEQSANDSGQSL